MRQKTVEYDKTFNPFNQKHEDSIFLVIAPDEEWEKMKKTYEQNDVQSKFIRFGRIIDKEGKTKLKRKVKIYNSGSVTLKEVKG